MRVSLFLCVLVSLPNSTIVWSVICDCNISWLFPIVFAVSMSLLASGDFFLLITFENSLNPEHDRLNVVPNCLTF